MRELSPTTLRLELDGMSPSLKMNLKSNRALQAKGKVEAVLQSYSPNTLEQFRVLSGAAESG